MKFLRIKFKPSAMRKPIFLRVSNGYRSNTEFVMGIEVDREGEEVSGRNFDQRQHLIERIAIEKAEAYHIDLKYGTLERGES